MKNLFKQLLIIGCLFISPLLFAQDGWNVVTVEDSPYRVLAGSLPGSSSGVNQKLKIDIFGGNWISSNLGHTTYYISTREGLVINKERHGGYCSGFTLKVYELPTEEYPGVYYNFVIESTITYAAYTVKAEMISPFRGVPTIPINVVPYDPSTSQGRDVTSRYPVNILMATGVYGEVGIGTDDPNHKLEVNGTIRAKEVKIDNNYWPDYVFSEDYKLSTLDEVARHIEENKHLPGIPSAKEVSENGLSVSEIQGKLLQKIEEMTLYMIRQEKEIKQLKEEVEKLKRKDSE